MCWYALPLMLAGLAQAPFDVVLTNGRIVDGTGAAWFRGDVALAGGKIVRMAPAGRLKDAPAARRIDVGGKVIAPGFIDIQSHSRAALLTGDGRVMSKVTQGVTTEIMGEGATNAPANEKTVSGMATLGRGADGKIEFSGPRGFDEWLRAMEKHGSSVNFGSYVGASTIRMYVKGMAQGSPTAAETAQMQQLVREAMKDGAFGLATALIYPPGEYATTEELIALSQAMAPYGGVYITHMRSEADQLLPAIDEAIRIGREGGVPVEIYHLKAGGKRNWPKMREAIAKINAARARGEDVQADMYTYVAGGTGLTACFPPSASADGFLFDNLKDPAKRKAIRAEITHQTSAWENLCELGGAENVLLLDLRQPENQPYAGKRLAEVAKMMGKDWIETAMDLVLSERQRIGTVFFLMDEDNVQMQMREPWMKFGSDAEGANPDKPGTLTHPRAYGNFTRLLGKYVREEKVMPLEEAVRKMTSATATRLSLHDRGVLREGLVADVVVFDPATIADRATFDKPHQVSVGVEYVFVNGVAVIDQGKHTGAMPGRIVRGPGYGQQ